MSVKIAAAKLAEPGEIERFKTKLLAENDNSRVITFTLSASSEDRVGDTLDVGGWRLENYKLNPVVLWGHEQRDLPVGKMVEIGVKGNKLVGSIQFATAEEYDFADTVFKLLKGGYLNAGSVGFRPTKWTFNDKGGIDFTEQELLEFSIVTVPCHPLALVNAKAAGVNLSPLVKVLEASPSERFTEIRTALEAQTPTEATAINPAARLRKSVELTAAKLRLLSR